MKLLNNVVNRVWLVLILATGITFWLGQNGPVNALGMGPVLVMFGLAFIKGLLVVEDFMGLRRAPLMWRLLMLGWLGGVTALIVLAYWLGLP